MPQTFFQRNRSAGFRGDASGFTLMELIIVTAILGTMSMAVYPVFNGTLKSIKREGAIDDLVATLQFAQSSAITQGVEHRVYLDPDASAYWISRREYTQDGEDSFKAVVNVSGDVHLLPPGLRFDERKLKARRDRSTKNAYYISFFPSGARDEAVITITVDGRRGEGYELSTKGKITRIDVSEL